MDRKNGCGGSDEKMDGFLYFAWHDHDKTDDNHRMLKIADDVKGGQFDLYFCSTKCLREFLNHCVDELEKSIVPLPAKKIQAIRKSKKNGN